MNELRDFLTQQYQAKPKRRDKIPYRKPESVKELERLVFEQKQILNPEIPYPVKRLFRDDSANGLTKCIVAWLQLHGYFGARVNVGGTYSTRLCKYIHSGSRRGMADITSIINGRHVSIEIKHGCDRMRPEQMKVRREFENSGGIYIVASTFDNFLEQIKGYAATKSVSAHSKVE